MAPFNKTAREPLRLEIFNLLGRRVRTLVNGYQEAGRYILDWDATDAEGRPLPSGVYLARLAAGDRRQTIKMTLLR